MNPDQVVSLSFRLPRQFADQVFGDDDEIITKQAENLVIRPQDGHAVAYHISYLNHLLKRLNTITNVSIQWTDGKTDRVMTHWNESTGKYSYIVFDKGGHSMTLQGLILELASRSTRPNPSQAIWITSCPDPVGEQYAEALAQATVKLEDNFNVHPLEESRHTYLGGTAEVWDIVSHSKITSWADCLVKLGWG